jgi:hypothetical protein
MRWGKKRNKKQRADLFDYNASDEPHIERKTARSMRRIVYVDGQKQRESHANHQKRVVNQYKAQRALLANEYLREKPDYSKVFDYETDGLGILHKDISEAIRSWVRYGLQKHMTYDQIKAVVISEFRLHKDAMQRREP